MCQVGGTVTRLFKYSPAASDQGPSEAPLYVKCAASQVDAQTGGEVYQDAIVAAPFEVCER